MVDPLITLADSGNEYIIFHVSQSSVFMRHNIRECSAAYHPQAARWGRVCTSPWTRIQRMREVGPLTV